MQKKEAREILRTLHYVLYNKFFYKSIPFFEKMLKYFSTGNSMRDGMYQNLQREGEKPHESTRNRQENGRTPVEKDS